MFDFSHTNLSLYRSIWSYSKVQRILLALQRFLHGVPDLRWGFVRNFSWNNGQRFCDYISQHNFGIYSNLSTSLEDILALYRANINVRLINYSAGMNWFKDQVGKDVYPVFFDTSKSQILDLRNDLTFDAFDVHKVYKQLPLSDLCKVASTFFYPSSSVLNTASDMIASAAVTPERSIAIVYRGTDKASEVKLARIEEYIRVAEQILQDNPQNFNVLIQTDSEQIRTKVAEHFGKICRYFNEIPVTRGTTVVHQLGFGTKIAMSREEFAKRIMAAALILSKCAYVITYTGNVGAWIAIYRGTSENLYQFDAGAKLQRP